jgi:hypothetical protein
MASGTACRRRAIMLSRAAIGCLLCGSSGLLKLGRAWPPRDQRVSRTGRWRDRHTRARVQSKGAVTASAVRLLSPSGGWLLGRGFMKSLGSIEVV